MSNVAFCILSIGAGNRSQSGIFLHCCSAHSIEVGHPANDSHISKILSANLRNVESSVCAVCLRCPKGWLLYVD